MIKTFKYALLLLAVVVFAAAFSYPSIMRCTLIGFSSFRQSEGKLFISPAIAKQDDSRIKTLLSDARTRIGYHFGDPVSTPTIIVVDSDEEAHKLGLGGAPGTLLIAPWGNYLLLHLSKGNLDVMAHELVHAEIAERLGYFNRITKFPTWLDEGIALQVDYRSEYSLLFDLDQTELARVTSLRTPTDFWTNDMEQNIKNYRSSKVAVNKTFFDKRTQSALYSLLDRLNAGEELSELLGR